MVKVVTGVCGADGRYCIDGEDTLVALVALEALVVPLVVIVQMLKVHPIVADISGFIDDEDIHLAVS